MQNGLFPFIRFRATQINPNLALCHILLFHDLQRLINDQQRASGVAVCGIVPLFLPLLIQLQELMRLKCAAVLIDGGIRSDRKQYA